LGGIARDFPLLVQPFVAMERERQLKLAMMEILEMPKDVL